MNEYSFTERHMGTDTTLSFVCEENSVATSLSKKIFDTVQKYEQEFSRFLPNSSLSQLNRNGSKKVSSQFLDVLEKSIKLHHLTHKAFNPLVQVKRLGYDQPFAALPTINNITAGWYNTNINDISIKKETSIVTLAPKQQLDFGGILKGYLAAELAEQAMQHQDCSGCIINLGGDLATRGRDELHKPFIFMLYNPITGIETPVTLTDTSLATSGTYARQWQTSQGTRHHIINTTTKQNPESELVAVSIIHKDGATTEAMTKLFFAHGVSVAMELLPPDTHQYQYFCVTKNGTELTNIV